MAAVIQVRSDVPFIDDVVTVMETADMEGYQITCSVTGADECLDVNPDAEWSSLEPAIMAAADHIRWHENRIDWKARL